MDSKWIKHSDRGRKAILVLLNDHVLHRFKRKLENFHDLSNGYDLFYLIKTLSDATNRKCDLKIGHEDVSAIAKKLNFHKILEYLKDKVKLIGLRPSVLSKPECTTQLTYLVWKILQYYLLHEEGGLEPEESYGCMIEWVNSRISKTPYSVNSLKDWKNPQILLSLFHSIYKGRNVNFFNEPPTTPVSPGERIQQILEFGQSEMGIPMILTPDDFLDPEEFSLMIYLCFVKHYVLFPPDNSQFKHWKKKAEKKVLLIDDEFDEKEKLEKALDDRTIKIMKLEKRNRDLEIINDNLRKKVSKAGDLAVKLERVVKDLKSKSDVVEMFQVSISKLKIALADKKKENKQMLTKYEKKIAEYEKALKNKDKSMAQMGEKHRQIVELKDQWNTIHRVLREKQAEQKDNIERLRAEVMVRNIFEGAKNIQKARLLVRKEIKEYKNKEEEEEGENEENEEEERVGRMLDVPGIGGRRQSSKNKPQNLGKLKRLKSKDKSPSKRPRSRSKSRFGRGLKKIDVETAKAEIQKVMDHLFVSFNTVHIERKIFRVEHKIEELSKTVELNRRVICGETKMKRRVRRPKPNARRRKKKFIVTHKKNPHRLPKKISFHNDDYLRTPKKRGTGRIGRPMTVQPKKSKRVVEARKKNTTRLVRVKPRRSKSAKRARRSRTPKYLRKYNRNVPTRRPEVRIRSFKQKLREENPDLRAIYGLVHPKPMVFQVAKAILILIGRPHQNWELISSNFRNKTIMQEILDFDPRVDLKSVSRKDKLELVKIANSIDLFCEDRELKRIFFLLARLVQASAEMIF